MSKIGDIAYITKYLAADLKAKNADEFIAKGGREVAPNNLFEGLENYYNTGGGDKVDFTDKQYYANGNTMLMLDTKNQRIAYVNTLTGEAEFKSLDQLAPSLKGQDIKFGKDELYKVTEPAGGVKKTEKGNIGVTGNDIMAVKQLAESKGLSMKDAVKEYYLSQNGGDMTKTLEALTGQPYNKDCAQGFLEEFRNKAFDTIAAKLAEKMKPTAETAVDNKDIVVNNYQGFNFDLNTALNAEEKLTLQESTKLDKDLFANNKAYHDKLVGYIQKLYPDLKVDDSTIKFFDKDGKSGYVKLNESVTLPAGSDGTSGNQSKVIRTDVKTTSLAKDKVKDGIDVDTTTTQDIIHKWDPMVLADDKYEYTFADDEDADGQFDGKKELLGYDKNWADMVKYDADGDGKISGDELDKLMVVRKDKATGKTEFISARKAGMGEIDLSSHKDKNEDINADQTLIGTFNVKMATGQTIEAQQTADTDSWLNKFVDGLKKGLGIQ